MVQQDTLQQQQQLQHRLDIAVSHPNTLKRLKYTHLLAAKDSSSSSSSSKSSTTRSRDRRRSPEQPQQQQQQQKQQQQQQQQQQTAVQLKLSMPDSS